MAIRSAIYLAGNKYKLFNTIKPYLQDGKRTTLVDVFGGSGTVTLNASDNSLFKEYICNEKAEHLYTLQKWVKNFISDEQYLAEDYNSKYESTRQGFDQMKKDYNSGVKDTAMLYNLMCRSNSNMMRFNSKGEYNMSDGKRNRFDIDRVWKHNDLIQNVTLRNEDFGDLLEEYNSLMDLSEYTFYLDSPYLGTVATYNENGGWTNNDNTSLLEFMLILQKKGAKVVMSNVFYNREKEHTQLIEWCNTNSDKFKVHHLNISYNNSSFRKGKGKTDEVLIVSL